MPPHLLTNFEIQKYYQNEPRFNYKNIIKMSLDLIVFILGII